MFSTITIYIITTYALLEYVKRPELFHLIYQSSSINFIIKMLAHEYVLGGGGGGCVLYLVFHNKL